ncbi:hypothetical protein ACIGW1_37245 [Streptomyces sp. NPDC053780]|uniref:hypothetical protein n=1 Tax=unclassified Streptomyces TaxID=2593676 RepID=UPI003430C7F3
MPGSLYGDQPYEAALSDLRSAGAKVSAALRDADGPPAEQLTCHQLDPGRAQLQLPGRHGSAGGSPRTVPDGAPVPNWRDRASPAGEGQPR